ncbi:MAG: hypothetical protein GY856_08675 [bacterium]|nr:hypothetical protein [bacterium]
MEQYALTGVLRGNVITLEGKEPILHEPERLEGRPVRVIVEPLLPAEEQQRRWRDWEKNGPHGPIEDE